MTSDMKTMNDVISNRLRQVNVALPGRIASYDPATRKADVLPLITEKYADGTRLTLRAITNVPVVLPATKGARVTLPVSAGDTVLIVFSQRSLDLWLSEGGVTDAGDIRMHSMSDAVAIPGLFSFNNAPSKGVELELTKSSATLKDAASVPGQFKASGGKIAAGTSAVELLDEVTKALDDIVLGLAAAGYTATDTIAASTAIKSIKGSL